jgi:hypothetical protein
METCPYSLQLSAYHDGELTEEQRRQLEQHLGSACPACQSELRQWRRLTSILNSATFSQLSQGAREKLIALAPMVREAGVIRLAEWVTALAASVLIAASTWMLVNRQHVQPASEPLAVAPLVLDTSRFADLSSDSQAEPQFDDWVVTNLAASGTHD